MSGLTAMESEPAVFSGGSGKNLSELLQAVGRIHSPAGVGLGG